MLARGELVTLSPWSQHLVVSRLAQVCSVWELLYPSDITLNEEQKGLGFRVGVQGQGELPCEY